MIRPRLPRSALVAVALSAVAGTIVTAVVIAGGGPAQGAPPKTLHLVGTAQKAVGFGPERKPRQGDTIGGGSKIAGDDTGFSRTVCTIIAKKALCTIQLKLSGGRLIAQGLVPDRTDRTPIAITGGTAAYNGARGTVFATQVSQTRTRLNVKLRP